LERVLSLRGLGLLFLGLAFALTRGGWLRPPLSRDLRCYHVPLLGEGPSRPAETLLQLPYRFQPVSVGTLLFALLALGVALVLWRPRWLGLAAGLLLAGAVCGNVVTVLNHPGLIQLLDNEYEQRRQMIRVVTNTPDRKTVTSTSNARITLEGDPTADEQRANLGHGAYYLLYSKWLIVWALCGCLLASRGRFPRRLVVLGGWLGLGLLAAGVLCQRRLHAEYYWLQAGELEARGDYAGSREALREGVALFPEFERLERTWLLAGKIDYRQDRSSPTKTYFESFQLTRNHLTPRGTAFEEDIPWVIGHTPDQRTGITPRNAGSEFLGNPQNRPKDIFARDYSAPVAPVDPGFILYYRVIRNNEERRAAEQVEDLLARLGKDNPVVRNHAARIWIDIGERYFLQNPAFMDSGGMDYTRQYRRLVEAKDAWQKAAELDPARKDYRFYRGLVQARLDPSHPERAEADLAPLLAEWADRPVRADILSTLAQTYFESGRVPEARKYYARSVDVFSLPKVINTRALEGLGGL
jgi:tetratricopeptide (TPR) repeat protein